jgi:hypothetical protein
VPEDPELPLVPEDPEDPEVPLEPELEAFTLLLISPFDSMTKTLLLVPTGIPVNLIVPETSKVKSGLF